MKKIFGERLNKLRKKNDELQADLAEILNVDTSMISKWEKGVNYPDVKNLIEIAEHYNVSTDYLLGLTKEIKSPYIQNNTINGGNNIINQGEHK